MQTSMRQAGIYEVERSSNGHSYPIFLRVKLPLHLVEEAAEGSTEAREEIVGRVWADFAELYDTRGPSWFRYEELVLKHVSSSDLAYRHDPSRAYEAGRKGGHG